MCTACLTLACSGRKSSCMVHVVCALHGYPLPAAGHSTMCSCSFTFSSGPDGACALLPLQP